MPKKTWDVEDDRKLRGSLDSTATFANDSYYRLWVVPEQGYTDGVYGNVWHLRSFQLADAATKFARFSFIKPEHWKRGVIKHRWHLVAVTNTGTADFRFTHRSRRYNFTDNAVGVSDLLLVTETFAMEDAGGATARDIYEPTGWDTRINLDTYEMITCELVRTGADGADTANTSLNVVGLELIFYPDARP